jgi:hypothetical protein
MRRVTVLLVILCALIVLAAIAPAGEVDSWGLDGVTKIRISGVSGDVVILPAESKQPVLTLRADVEPKKSFEPIVERSGSVIKIKEKWSNSSRSDVTWTLYLPERGEPVTVHISNASGDLTCSGVAVKIDLETASGDIELRDVDLAEGSDFATASGDYSLEGMTIKSDSEFSTASGNFELEGLTIEADCEFSTASGDIIIENCTCEDDVDFSSASGDVEVRNSNLTGQGEFSSASGDVTVQLAALPHNGLSASSASGDVMLDVESYGDDFTLIITKRKNKGKIQCPFEYTDEEEFDRHEHTYVRKIIKRGSGEPLIELSTASGNVVVKK